MAKYFQIKNSTDIKITGTFPQISCLNQFHAHQLKFNEFPDFTPNLSFEFDKKAKATDVLSQAAISADGLVINQKVKDLLCNYVLIDHSYFPIEINAKSNDQYYWLHLVASLENLNWINFKESSFYLKKGLKNLGEINLNSKEEYVLKKNELGTRIRIKATQIVLNESFNKLQDMFVLPRFGTNIYLSEQLHTIILQHNISGIETKEAIDIQ